jgi:hypothetical protein
MVGRSAGIESVLRRVEFAPLTSGKGFSRISSSSLSLDYLSGITLRFNRGSPNAVRVYAHIISTPHIKFVDPRFKHLVTNVSNSMLAFSYSYELEISNNIR